MGPLKMLCEMYLSPPHFEDLLRTLSKGGRWYAVLPDHADSIEIVDDGKIEGMLYLDFCPELNDIGSFVAIKLDPINCYPEPWKIKKNDQIRIQFNNEQRRSLLAGQ